MLWTCLGWGGDGDRESVPAQLGGVGWGWGQGVSTSPAWWGGVEVGTGRQYQPSLVGWGGGARIWSCQHVGEGLLPSHLSLILGQLPNSFPTHLCFWSSSCPSPGPGAPGPSSPLGDSSGSLPSHFILSFGWSPSHQVGWSLEPPGELSSFPPPLPFSLCLHFLSALHFSGPTNTASLTPDPC